MDREFATVTGYVLCREGTCTATCTYPVCLRPCASYGFVQLILALRLPSRTGEITHSPKPGALLPTARLCPLTSTPSLCKSGYTKEATCL
eukprot:5032866-Prymnesium_polylepis.1